MVATVSQCALGNCFWTTGKKEIMMTMASIEICGVYFSFLEALFFFRIPAPESTNDTVKSTFLSGVRVRRVPHLVLSMPLHMRHSSYTKVHFYFTERFVAFLVFRPTAFTSLYSAPQRRDLFRLFFQNTIPSSFPNHHLPLHLSLFLQDTTESTLFSRGGALFGYLRVVIATPCSTATRVRFCLCWF